MSLKIWLPLTKDLYNQGTSGIDAITVGGTIESPGKIGNCYYLSSSSRIYTDLFTPASNNFSICCWYKAAVDNTASGYIMGLSRKTEPSFMVYKEGSTKFRLYGNGSNNSFTHGITVTEWHHLTLTYNGTQCKFYIDGVQKSSRSFSVDFTTSNYRIFLNARSNNSSDSGAGSVYGGNNYYNDLRYYDHCLSPLEVKEIAQGLVLHYKLDSQEIQSGTNLVTGVTKGGRTALLTDGRIGVQTSGTNADTYFTINLSENIVNGTKYLLTCEASGISEGQYWGFPLGAQNNSSLLFKIYNGHNEYAFTANDISWGTNRLFLDDSNRSDWSHPASFYNFQLIKVGSAGNTVIVKDSSGYNHNGNIVGTTTSIVSNCPRYSRAISMNNTSTTNHIESKEDITISDNMTISCWVKASLTKNQVIFTTDTIQFGIVNQLGYVQTTSSSPGYQLSSYFISDKWNHICVVRSAGNYTLYVNGETPPRNGGSNYYLHNVSKLWLLNRSHNSSYGADASISDFRIYCTPLLDTDIKLLYNSSMRVDNLQNIHTFELVEQGRELLNGIPFTTSYGTHSKTSNLYTPINEEIKLSGTSISLGSDYIQISPTGHTYQYDIIYSCSAGNQFYIGFHRYDAAKTSRSNNACQYVVTTKPTSDVSYVHVKGTVNLATDGTNPTDTISLRVLNGWSGSASDSTKTSTIHYLSLREIATAQKPQIKKNGQFIVDELREYNNAKFYNNSIVETAEIIER